jgi:putative ABC transport system permease protein
VSTPGLVTGVMGRTAAVRIWTPATPAEGTRQFPMLASPGALDAIAVPLLAGRQFDDSDAERLRQVIVNEPFARKFFHGPALGRTFRLALESAPERSEEVTIVGIAGGIMRQADSEGPLLYSPTTLEPLPARALYVRTDGTQSFSIAALSAAVRAIDARVPVSSSSTLAETRAGRHRERQLLARGAAALGLVALVLAAGGLYGVVSYVVSLRRQEVGIRLALGAEARSIVVMITRQALTPALIGAVIGLLGAAIAGRVVQSNLYGSAPTDLRVFAGSTALLLVVLFAATIIPARRAAGINPLDTLRTE